jgi:beta-glucosidase
MRGFAAHRPNRRRSVLRIGLGALVVAIGSLALGLGISAAAPPSVPSNVPYALDAPLPSPAGSPSVDAAAPYTPAVLSLIAQLEPSNPPTQAQLANASALLHDGPNSTCHNVGPVSAPAGTTPSITPICWTDAQGVLNTSGNNARGSTAPTTLMALGATFDRQLGNAWGQAFGTEAREFMVTGTFGPQTDLDRLPNWGRNLTTTGEDPFLSHQMVATQINGIQGVGAMSQMKHFVVYNGQNQNLNTDIQDQGLHELYLTPYEGGFVDGRAAATMCSYQQWRDTSSNLPGPVPALTQPSPLGTSAIMTWPLNESHFSCEQPLSLDYVLRGMWGSKALVGSDYPATHSTSAIVQGEDQEMPTQAGYFSATDPLSTTSSGGFGGPPSAFDPTGSTCADAAGNYEPCTTAGAVHVAGIPNNFQGSGGSGCPFTFGCTLVASVADHNLPVSLFNQSLARILYQEQRFGMLGCNDSPPAASCKNPGGVGSDRTGTALLPTGSTGQLGTQVGDDAVVERMAEESATLLKNEGHVLPITHADLSGGILVTGSSANHTIADPTAEASTGFIGRDAINPLQQLKGFSGDPDAFKFIAANDPDGITVPTSALSTTADSSGLGGLNLSVDGGPVSQDTTAIDHEAVHGNQLAPGHTYAWSGYLYVPTADTYTFALQQSPTLPTTLNCPQTGQFNTPPSNPTLTLCSPFTAANASQTNSLPDAVTFSLDGTQLNLNATTADVYPASRAAPVPSNPTTAGALDQGLISRTCATGSAALEPGTTNCSGAQSALTPGFHAIKITVNNATNCVSTPPAAAAPPNPAVAATPAPCVPASFRFAYSRASGDIADAAAAAKGKSLALVFVNDGTGTTSSTPTGAPPGTTISAPTQLSNASTNLINAVAAANPNTVVVLNTANPVLTPWLPNAKGVLEDWFAGQEGGTAMARVLLGLANPSGHTALTWPANATDTIWGYDETRPLYPGDTLGTHPERLNGNGGCTVPAGSTATCPAATGTVESEGIYSGYRFFDKEGITPQFPFGFGLSYTTFGFSRLKVRATADGGADVSFRVRNTGQTAGADAVQVYVGPPSYQPSGIQFAVRSLAQFARVSLDAGQSQIVNLHVPARQLSYWSEKAQKWILDAGGRQVFVGDADALSNLPLRSILGGHQHGWSHQATACANEQINATIVNGDLTVPNGAWCDLVDVTVRGDLKLNHTTGARILGVTVYGDLRAKHAAGAADPLSSGSNVICNTTVHGNLEVQNSHDGVGWNIGGCGANTVDGNLDFHGNHGHRNTLSNNHIKGDLSCAADGAISKASNHVAGRVNGQCQRT